MQENHTVLPPKRGRGYADGGKTRGEKERRGVLLALLKGRSGRGRGTKPGTAVGSRLTNATLS